jgi:tetratricopeptide (TPR) repeat protein
MGKAATLYMDMNELQDATVVLAQSAALFEKAGRRDLQGQALGNLGTTFGRLGRWKEAGYRHSLALQIARDIEDIEEERFQLSNLAYVCEAEGHIDWAIHYNRQALYISLIEGHQDSIADITLSLGRVLLMDATASNLKQAILLLEKSVDLNPQDEAVRLLGRAQRRLERLESAGYSVPAAETNLQTYAQSAYEMSQ